MSYLCRKGLNISGVAYKPGDIIPDRVILPNRVRTLSAVGMISEIAENTETPVVNAQPVVSVPVSTISIPVKGDNGDITLEVTPEEVQEVFSLLQMTANEGITAIGKIESDNVLILIHTTDSRKTIQNAARERADVLDARDKKDAPSVDNDAANGNDEAASGESQTE